VRQVPLTIEKVKESGPERPITVVFDREDGVRSCSRRSGKPQASLPHRKAAKGKRLPRLAEQLFTPRTIEVNGREVIYDRPTRRSDIVLSEGRRRKHRSNCVRSRAAKPMASRRMS
jgi:hypothetical protein